jgi:intracellular septation protein
MIKFLTEFVPIVAFFIGYQIDGILGATIYTLIASLVGLVLSYAIEKQINTIALVSAGLLSVSAWLTISTGNADFIKMKPTALYILFCIILFVTIFKGTPALKYILGGTITLKDDQNWKILNIRFMIFFLLMAVLNELVWRSFTENAWVNFKVFIAIPVTFIFSLLQIPYIIKNKKLDLNNQNDK